MAYGHGSGLPPWEAPVMIAERRKLFFLFLSDIVYVLMAIQGNSICHYAL